MKWGRLVYLLTAWLLCVGAIVISIYAALHAPSPHWQVFDMFVGFVGFLLLGGVVEEAAA